MGRHELSSCLFSTIDGELAGNFEHEIDGNFQLFVRKADGARVLAWRIDDLEEALGFLFDGAFAPQQAKAFELDDRILTYEFVKDLLVEELLPLRSLELVLQLL